MQSVADLISQKIKGLRDLDTLDLDSSIENIYGELSGDQLYIVNKFFKARGFRKIHIEIAKFGSSLEILHCVFFPSPFYDLPIFGVDIVSGIDGISAAIVDLSPVSDDLPQSIQIKLNSMPDKNFLYERKLPKWGDIFSNYVKFIKPANKNECDIFFSIVEYLLDTLITYSLSLEPNSSVSETTIKRYQRQQYYCKQQKCNDKTRKVLAKFFGPSWADQYIDIVLFECPNSLLEENL